jgi:glucan phosphorylase
MPAGKVIACFSMEIALEPDIPTYSGGLGVLAGDTLRGQIKVAYLANYDWELGRLMTAGVDVWLNTPNPPMEASGTSGLKAALNGVPSLGIFDGWWIEGCIEGVTGGAIDSTALDSGERTAHDAASLYEKADAQARLKCCRAAYRIGSVPSLSTCR